jgi:hypothetical protein
MIKPKVLLVEEAGQVLESHIIAALVPSGRSFLLVNSQVQLLSRHFSGAPYLHRRPSATTT